MKLKEILVNLDAKTFNAIMENLIRIEIEDWKIALLNEDITIEELSQTDIYTVIKLNLKENAFNAEYEDFMQHYLYDLLDDSLQDAIEKQYQELIKE